VEKQTWHSNLDPKSGAPASHAADQMSGFRHSNELVAVEPPGREYLGWKELKQAWHDFMRTP